MYWNNDADKSFASAQFPPHILKDFIKIKNILLVSVVRIIFPKQ